MSFVARWEPAPALDALDLYSMLRAEGLDGALLEAPDAGRALVAGGSVHALPSSGGAEGVVAAIAERPVRLESAGPSPGVAGLWVGGMAFDPQRHRAEGRWEGFAAVHLALPRFAWCRSAGRTMLAAFGESGAACAEHLELGRGLVAAAAAGRALPAEAAAREVQLCAGECPDAFRTRVESAVSAFAEQRLHKVVLARDVVLRAPGGLSAGRVLRRLRDAHRDCTSFAIASGDATFLGATPERLLRVEDRCLRTSALAGSAPRGASPEADAALARALRESKKDQEEHAFVVAAIREALAPLCESLHAPEAPELLATRSIQHLHTPFEGRLRPGVGAAQLMAALHPTPAVGGAPSAAALCYLRENEPLERGLYAGPVGWLGSDGSGELAVALRCALLRRSEATLFAGAGIVPGSSPEAELEETRLKLRPLLSAAIEI